MSFIQTIERARAMLERNGRLSLRALQREFELDDEVLEDLIEELVDVKQIAAREGKVLSWIGAVPTEPPALEAERRHLTVMFCDLVGSTELSRHLDAEALRNIVRAFQASSAQVIEGYEGHIAQYLGDGLLVYFGYPQAHEDDPERAVRASLEMLRELGALNPRLEAEYGIKLAVRVGIHTGLVVVGEMGGGATRETLALGDTPNIAAHIQAVAAPGTVVISDATLRLVEGLFVTEARTTPRLKGISEPIGVHHVLHPSGLTSRLDRLPMLTPFVGREHELGLVLDRFEQAQKSRGQAVLIAGEAGIGKSRLAQRLREQLAETRHTWLECHTTPYTQSSPLYPLIEMMEAALGFEHEDSSEAKLARLERGLSRAGLETAKTVPFLASLLALPLPERYPPLEISPQLQRRKTLEALADGLLALAEKRPVVVLVEDLHWIDPSTLEWLGLLVERCQRAHLLLLLTHRPEFEPPWPTRAQLHSITLGRLGRSQTRDLVAASIPGETLPEQVIDQLARRSDGIPLFAEELAKGAIEAGFSRDGSLSSKEIPETLQDSLRARFDRLGDAKEVAQLGAAIGREFEYTLLEAVAPLSNVALRERLGRLVASELVYSRGPPPKATYAFKHALMRDTAYQSLLESRRREIHAHIADALEQHFPEQAARQPERVARHSEAAGRTAEAITQYQHAGENAAGRFAQPEAVAHLQRAIALLGKRPESADRDRQELRLLIGLGPPLQAVRGMYSPEVGETYARALSLARSSRDEVERFEALSGLAIFYRNSEVTRALELGEELLAHAERTGEPSQLLFAHSTLSVAFHYLGDLSKALVHEEGAIALYDPIEHRSLDFVYGLNPGIVALCLASFTLLQLGHADRALERVEEAIAQARADAHPYSLAYALNWGAIVDYVRGEPRRVLGRAEEAIEISTERGFSQQLGGGLIFRASALAFVGDTEAAGRGLDQLSESLQARTGPVGGPFYGAIADAFRRIDRLDEALGVVDRWLVYSAETNAPYWDAEFLRLKGEIWRARNPADCEEAASLFHRAIATARSQDAKCLELRAALSLTRLLLQQNRHAEARTVLAPIYGWFTEGFDTQDLKDARALLDELA